MRVGVDTGGTFTDAVSEDGKVCKLSSSRSDPGSVVVMALRALANGGEAELIHGTTVATNAVLESRLARVGVLVDEGFRDILLIGRQSRPALYDLEPRKAWLPTSSQLSAEVPGRMLFGGVEESPLDRAAAKRALSRLRRAGAQTIAIVRLHGYANPAHENALLALAKAAGFPATASSTLNPEFREVERGVATVINAGLLPEAGEYLNRLRRTVGKNVRVLVMASDGCLLTPDEAAEEPARLLVSGPVGGVLGARAFAAACKEERVVTLDMGGTSTDVAWLSPDPVLRSSLHVAGLDVRLPSLDIHTVGAGGGSLLRQDPSGGIAVGPESAGSDPGPAAYGRSDRLTVTDANLLLGRMAPKYFAAGEGALDLVHAERCARAEARRHRMSLKDLLIGVVRLADAAMSRAIRRVSMEQGRDPRGSSLLVFGGAGGQHGVALARSLGMRRVLVPPNAGVLSALGLLHAPEARARSRTVMRSGIPSRLELQRMASDLAEPLRNQFRAEGRKTTDLEVLISCDLRYRGQSYEIEIPFCDDLAGEFHRRHESLHGFSDPARALEFVALRTRVRRKMGSRPLRRLKPRSRGSPAPASHLRSAVTKGMTPVYDREQLFSGDQIIGPAVLAEKTGTVFLPKGARARVHPTGTLVVEVGSEGAT